MKLLAACLLLICFSINGKSQHFLFNSNYSYHQLYDSGTYNFKTPGNARAHLFNLGVSYKWGNFNLGILASLGTVKNYEIEGNIYSQSNIIGAGTFINYHFFKEERNFYLDPFVMCGYGFKRISLNSGLITYNQASYGVGTNVKITERIKISLTESFNLSLKNLFFNNVQTAVGLQWQFSSSNTKALPEDYENLNQKIKEDSLNNARQIKEIEFKWLYKQRKLKDSLEKQIELQKKTIDKLMNDKNTLLGSSVTLKSQIDEIRKNSWAEYEIYKLSKDTLIKINQLPARDYASYTASYLPEALDRKNIIAIKGTVYICINKYNYYKICIEANASEPIIPLEFLKYYPLAELWKLE